MGLSIVLETEAGEVLDRVDDVSNLLHHILPSHDDTGYRCTNCIDWYGNTTFNWLQIPEFLAEWSRLLPVAQERGGGNLHGRVESMAMRCRAAEHLYLKFYGD